MTQSRDLREVARVIRTSGYFLKAKWVNAEDAESRRLFAEGISAAETIAQINEARAEFLAWCEAGRR